MKRNGFTLIELMVSIVLVTIVLASMSVALIKLKDTYNKTNDKTDIDLVTSSITRIISNDIINNGNVTNIVKLDDKSLEITLDNIKKRIIRIENLDDYKPSGTIGTKVAQKAGNILNVITVIGIVVGVITLIVIGIKSIVKELAQDNQIIYFTCSKERVID